MKRCWRPWIGSKSSAGMTQMEGCRHPRFRHSLRNADAAAEKNDQWSLAWDGGEGYVRNGKCEGAAMDGGDHSTPPLSLRLMLDEARKNHVAPASIAVYATVPDAMPDLEAWQKRTRDTAAIRRNVGKAGKAPADAGGQPWRGENRRWQISCRHGPTD